MSKNALTSLNANYTDSENEDERDSDENSPRTENSNESQVCSTGLSWILPAAISLFRYV